MVSLHIMCFCSGCSQLQFPLSTVWSAIRNIPRCCLDLNCPYFDPCCLGLINLGFQQLKQTSSNVWAKRRVVICLSHHWEVFLFCVYHFNLGSCSRYPQVSLWILLMFDHFSTRIFSVMLDLHVFVRAPPTECQIGFFPWVGLQTQSMGEGIFHNLQSQSQILQWIDWYPPLWCSSLPLQWSVDLCFLALLHSPSFCSVASSCKI